MNRALSVFTAQPRVDLAIEMARITIVAASALALIAAGPFIPSL